MFAARESWRPPSFLHYPESVSTCKTSWYRGHNQRLFEPEDLGDIISTYPVSHKSWITYMLILRATVASPVSFSASLFALASDSVLLSSCDLRTSS